MHFNLSALFSSIFFSTSRFSKAFCNAALLSLALALTVSLPSQANNTDVNANKSVEDKLYRQALYFYFTGDYGGALRQIGLNRQRINANSSRRHLFEAGLQVSVGLHQKATETLSALEKNQTTINHNDSFEKESNQGTSSTSPEELMLIALLQLAEQQIQQGENKTAQKTLSKMTKISTGYHDQFHILNQLAYWPELPIQATNVDNTKTEHVLSFSSSPYIALNQALLHSEHGEFELAELMLTEIKTKQWQAPSMTFWQLLFNPFSGDDEDNKNGEAKDKQNQQQAINDYAQLLLAQLYVKQERYESAYYELKNFPQDSPYTESALFIFAFSAQKIKQYTTSLKLLDLMQERYPYSNLGWQASLLLASQVIDQKTPEEGMTSYQNAERLYQQRLIDLTHFHRDFRVSNNLLTFASNPEVITTVDASSTMLLSTQQTYTTDSLWLQKALLDVELQAHYQALIELDLLRENLHGLQTKNQWLQDSLILNNQRKAKVIEAQEKTNYSAIIAELNNKKQHVSEVIFKAEAEQQGQPFANQAEAQWLKRIAESKQLIASIKGHKNIDDYQERLTRVESALAWQLQKELPDRLWQHKKQLKEIDQQLIAVEQQRKRFVALANSQQLLSGIEERIQFSSGEVSLKLNTVVQLRTKTSQKIQSKVQQFVDNQRSLLNQHLLTTRHEMAAVLEQMSQVDKRIELQLAPSVPKSKVTSLGSDSDADNVTGNEGEL